MTTSCRLYLISPPRLADVDAFASLLEQALDGGDVAAFQLRLKGPADAHTGVEAPAADDAIRAACERLVPLTQSRGVAFLLNDRPDLAAELDCDGVHVGQQDAPYGDARAALGGDKTVGVTCHDSRHLAMEAAEAGADYVAFGAFFPTATKAPAAQATLEILEWWSQLMTTPCVAIGGITPDTCGDLARAGADFVAASSAVWTHDGGPAAGVAAFEAALNAAAPSHD